MQALKPMFYLMILFIVIVFLYYGVPAGAVLVMVRLLSLKERKPGLTKTEQS